MSSSTLDRTKRSDVPSSPELTVEAHAPLGMHQSDYFLRERAPSAGELALYPNGTICPATLHTQRPADKMLRTHATRAIASKSCISSCTSSRHASLRETMFIFGSTQPNRRAGHRTG